MQNPAIEAIDVGKRYGSLQAVRSLRLRVEPGQVFGLLGPNGAGKTTTLRMLMGMLVPDEGRATIHGLDCSTQRVRVMRRVGYAPDVTIFPENLSGWELLHFAGKMHGLDQSLVRERGGELMATLGIWQAATGQVHNYSLGMKRKLGLVLALLHSPDVLILDEPTTGLDPEGARHMRQLIGQYAQTGRTVLLSTHLLDMADRICHRVGIVNHGSLVAEGDPAELRNDCNLPASASLEEVFFAFTRGTGNPQRNTE